MDGRLQNIFVHEVERQSQFALIAAADLQAAVDRGDTDRVWNSIQFLLVTLRGLAILFSYAHNCLYRPASRMMQAFEGV